MTETFRTPRHEDAAAQRPGRNRRATHPQSDVAVSVRDLRKSYAGGVALGGISFDIRRGETFALLGPNGAGKSTTIEILEGYRDRTSGDVSVLGEDPQRGGVDWKARLGIVLQSGGETGNVTVREQLSHFAGYYDHPRGVEETIAAVGLGDKANTRIRALSGGQRRRVDVALGVIGRPELLFLDEPTTGFDPEARRSFWDLVRQLKSDGTTILLTTHYLDEAAQLSDRIAIIANGELVDIGTLDEIGGPDARVPIVRWRDDAGAHAERTTEPASFVASMRSRMGGEPAGLEVIRPSLEDVYLGLVGVANQGTEVSVGEAGGSGGASGSGPSTSSGTGSSSSGTGSSSSGTGSGTSTSSGTGGGPSTSSGTGSGPSTSSGTGSGPSTSSGTGHTGAVRLGVRRALFETRTYFRQGDTVTFTFLFPVVMLAIFSIAFSAGGNVGTNPDGSGGISQAAYYLPGMIAAGILLSGVQNLAIDIAMERSDGTLKRLAGTPLPVASYFIGKFGQVLLTSALQVALLLLVARVGFGVELPTDAARWATFAWVYLLGITTSAVLGIALSRVPRTGKSATAVIIPIVLVLQFISGVYLAFTMLPEWLQNVASAFPLKWMAQGMRSVFLPEDFAVIEQTGAWELGAVAVALAIWLVVGAVMCRATFRWIRKDT